MKKLNRHPPPSPATTDSKVCHHDTILRFKHNARQRRLRIRRLKYTCEAKIHVAAAGDRRDGVEDRNKDREIHESMQISLSLTTSKNNKDRPKLAPDDDVVLGEKLKELSYGSVSVIGSRKEMEDEVSIEMGFVVKERAKCDFFAVYDGHGGAQVAKACRERLFRLVAEEVERHGSNDELDWEGMMEGCFGKMDMELAEDAAVRTVGSTAVVAVVAKEEVIVANCGDCRAVMGSGGHAFALSNDHKPDRPDELMRIEAAGGRVINWNGQRVLGVLATSRSIGDQYLRPYVISEPEVTVTKRSKEDEFLILGSDGLWDVISSETACEVVRKCLSSSSGETKRNSNSQEQSLAAEAAALLVQLAMAKGSRDNTSVIVVDLNNHTTI